MNAALCREVGAGAFPTPAQVATCGAEQLQKRCGLGYRARTLCKLAEQVSNSRASQNGRSASRGCVWLQ